MTTPGYRARQSFAGALERPETGRAAALERVSLAEGPVNETGSPFDLALSGKGLFVLDGGSDGPVYTRNGQFSRDADGRLTGLGGRAVQAIGGGDLIVPETVTIGVDGSILDRDRVIGRIAVVSIAAEALTSASDGALSAPAEAATALEAPVVRQGFLEASNVVLGEEMIVLMEAMRRAETGQRLMNLYDDLMGRAVTTFGQANG